MLTYRKFNVQDAEQTANLMIKLHKDLTLDEAKSEAILFSKRDVTFIALDGNRVVGYVHGAIRRDYVEGSEQLIDPKTGYIESLYILPKYRKQGAAKTLCKMLEDWSKEQGALEFASDAYASNRQSRAFHKAIGLVESKPIVHYIKKI